MRAIRVFFASVLAVLMFGLPANAQEPPKWDGLYGGFHTGFAIAKGDWTDNVFGQFDIDIEGWLVGLPAGWNFRHDNILYGIEVDGSLVDAGDDFAPCAGGPPCRVDWNSLGTFRGRLGWIMGDQDQYALYITGGYAVSGWDALVAIPGGTNGFVRHGWLIGGGGEAYLFDTNWLSTKIEYNYISFTGGAKTYTAGSVDSITIDVDHAHVVKFGLILHY